MSVANVVLPIAGIGTSCLKNPWVREPAMFLTSYLGAGSQDEALCGAVDAIAGENVSPDARAKATKLVAEHSAQNFIEMSENYIGGSVGGIAGAAAATALTLSNPIAAVAARFALPVAGSMLGTYVTSSLLVPEKADLVDFFVNLQTAGEQKNLSAEQAFVMTALHMPKLELGVLLHAFNKKSKGKISDKSKGKISDVTSLLKALKDPKSEAYRAITEMMSDPAVDAHVQAMTGVQMNMPGQTASGTLAQLVNAGHLHGIQLLDPVAVNDVTLHYNASVLEQLQQQQQYDVAEVTRPSVPNLNAGKPLAV